jgi:hypothetical protein
MTSNNFLFAALASLSMLSGTQAQNIASDTYFYGQSPPFYPSRTVSDPQSVVYTG